MSFQLYISSIVCWDHSQARSETWSEKAEGIHRHAIPKVKKGIAGIPWYTMVSNQDFSSFNRSMRATKIIHISEDRMGVTKIFQHSKANNKRCMHETLWQSKATVPRNGSVWGRIKSWTTRDYRQNELSTRQSRRQHHPETITFNSKSLSDAERRYSNIKIGALAILCGLEKLCHICFTREVSLWKEKYLTWR